VEISWNSVKCVGMCTDGARTVLGMYGEFRVWIWQKSCAVWYTVEFLPSKIWACYLRKVNKQPWKLRTSRKLNLKDKGICCIVGGVGPRRRSFNFIFCEWKLLFWRNVLTPQFDLRDGIGHGSSKPGRRSGIKTEPGRWWTPVIKVILTICVCEKCVIRSASTSWLKKNTLRNKPN
jgi:hypothetical protein